MLGTVLTQVIAKVTSFLDLCLAWISVLMTPCRTIIAVGIDRMTLIAQYIKSQCVALKLSIKPLVAQFTNQVPYGTQILVSTIGALLVVLVARFLGGRR